MMPEPADVLHLISTAGAAIFVLILVMRLWKLRNFGIRSIPSWKGRVKAVSIPVSPISRTRNILITSLGSRALAFDDIVRVLDRSFELGCSA
jgi:hypothetical protein